MAAPSDTPREAVRFTLERRPLAEAERAIFARDLRTLDLDDHVLVVLDGLVSTSTPDDIPYLMLGHRGDALVFAAHPIVSRRTMRTFFPNRLGSLLDMVPSPAVSWTRHDPGVDLCGSPGFVADGEDREALVDEAIAFLAQRYLTVTVIEEEGTPRRGRFEEVPLMDTGRYEVGSGQIDALFARHGHLRRKVSKFRNKGGTIEVVRGALGERDRDGVLHCIRCAQSAAVLRTPYQDNYCNMVDWASRTDLRAIVHVLARLEGALVGYHSFVESGRQLLCLSGGFDRTRHTTYHAYENVLLEAMRHAEERGLARVLFGPVLNRSKVALMPAAGRLTGRLFSRSNAMLAVTRFIVPRSALRPAALAPFRGVGLNGTDAA